MSPRQDAPAPEMELKFHASQAALEQLRSRLAIAGDQRARRLSAVYFDTADHALRRAGLTLRVREVDGGFFQTVKRQAAGRGFVRDEWEAPVADVEPDLAVLEKTPVGGLLGPDGAAALKPIMRVDVERTIVVRNVEGAEVEISLDVGEAVVGSHSEPICELELELKSGPRDALFTAAGELVSDIDLRLSFESKADRGFRLAADGGPVALKAEHVSVPPAVTVAEAFRIIARSCLSHIAASVELLERTQSPDAIHQTRIGVRRLRAAISIFREIVRDQQMDQVRSELKWFTGELGPARDLDVFLQDTMGVRDDYRVDDAATIALRRGVTSAQGEAYERAMAAARSQRYGRMLFEVVAWIEAGPWSKAEDQAHVARCGQKAHEFAARSLRRLRKRVRLRGEGLAEMSPEERHELRKLIKKLRYATEFFADTFGPVMKRRRKFVDALKALQEHLGRLNDVSLASETARTVIAGRSSEAAFAAGLQVGRREGEEPGFVVDAAKAFRKFTKTRPFWKEVWPALPEAKPSPTE